MIWYDVMWYHIIIMKCKHKFIMLNIKISESEVLDLHGSVPQGIEGVTHIPKGSIGMYLCLVGNIIT